MESAPEPVEPAEPARRMNGRWRIAAIILSVLVLGPMGPVLVLLATSGAGRRASGPERGENTLDVDWEPAATFARRPHRAVLAALSGYAKFSGRASRSEFWWFLLFCAASVVLLWPTAFLLIVPLIAVGWRRMHDRGRSGLLFLPVLALLAAPALIWVPFSGDEFYASGDAPLAMRWLVRGAAYLITGLAAQAIVLILPYTLYTLVRPGDAGPNRFG